MEKRMIHFTCVMLFTGILCLASMNAQPHSEKTAGTAENGTSALLPSQLKITQTDEILSESTQSDPAQPETARTGSVQLKTAQTDSAQLDMSPTDAALSGSIQVDAALLDIVQLDTAQTGSVQQLEEVQSDKAALLSIVSSLPGGEELTCSDPDILSLPQIKKVRSIIRRFQEDGNQISFIVLDLDTGNYFSLNPDLDIYSASAIKGPYVAALNKFNPEIVDEYTGLMMENTIRWSSNEDYENLHYLYGNDAMYDMTAYTDVSDSIIDEYNWYPYLTAKELTRLWIGTYLYFFEDTNENSKWCRSLYTDSTESFIGSALGDEYTVYTKPGWYSDWEDVSRNDAGIVMADGHDYILTIMSDAFDSYDALEELTAALDDVHTLLCPF